MRVAHVITRMIVGGAQENTLYNCLDLQRDYGDEVLLITGPTLGPEGKLLEQGREEGLRVMTIDSLRRSINPIRDRHAYSEIRSALKEFDPDIVHTHSAKGGMLGRAAGWSLAKESTKRIRVIHTVHGAPFHPYQNFFIRNFYRRCEAWAANRCHRMISVADAMTKLMVDAEVAPASKFKTIYSGMDVEPFLHSEAIGKSVRSQYGLEDQNVVVGKVARLFELKGHEYLIAAAQKVLELHPHVRFLLVGDGNLRRRLEARIAELGLSHAFVFTGLVPPESIPGLIAAMDLLVHTSLREGLARTLPQALISGKPVVSYDIDGAREVCIEGVTGHLLEPQSIEPLADAIIDLAEDQDKRNRWGRAGQQRFTEQFRHSKMTQRIRELYVQCLEQTYE